MVWACCKNRRWEIPQNGLGRRDTEDFEGSKNWMELCKRCSLRPWEGRLFGNPLHLPVEEVWQFTSEHLVKQDVFSAVFEVCVLTCLQLCECKFIFFCYFIFVMLLWSTWVYPVLTCKIFAVHWCWNATGARFRHPTGPAHPSRFWTSLCFCWIMSVTQKISVFRLNQTAVSPGSHLLSSAFTLTTIPLLSRK